jgi:hypothetical protein
MGLGWGWGEEGVGMDLPGNLGQWGLQSPFVRHSHAVGPEAMFHLQGMRPLSVQL